jgi:hypothetical protein
MDEKKMIPADKLGELQARLKEHLSKFEETRGFL